MFSEKQVEEENQLYKIQNQQLDDGEVKNKINTLKNNKVYEQNEFGEILEYEQGSVGQKKQTLNKGLDDFEDYDF